MADENSGQRSASPQESMTNVPDNSSGGSFPFLVHSQDTLQNNFAPKIDNHPLARQKRRRTSPEDQAILEAEYEKNSKPDKSARMEIVKRVALGEKEVQIWFQNRRQMTRRRSRPSSSQDSGVSDVFSSQDSTGPAVYSSFSSNFSSNEIGEEYLSSQTSVHESQSVPEAASLKLPEASGNNKTIAMSPSPGAVATVVAAAPEVAVCVQQPDAPADPGMGFPVVSDKLPFPSVKSKSSAKSGSSRFAGCQSSPPMIHEDLAKCQSGSALQSHRTAVVPRGPASLPSTLRRTSSLIRLSTTFDGKARVTTGSESPSPPKIRAPRPVISLQRSQSAIEPRHRPDEEVPSPSFRSPKRLMTGRSRDARTWEFYCDNDARDALTEQAEREQSGSAAGAIGLMRSRSNKVLASNPNKRNVNASKPESLRPVDENEPKTHKRKLNRTISSVARLQTTTSSRQAVNPGPKKPKSGSQTELLEDPGDSDKENWEPGTQTRTYRRRRPANALNNTKKSRPVLKESLHIPSQSTSQDPFLDNEHVHHRDGQENAASGKEDEGATEFMSGNVLPREADDLDAVQNLLSLSQGAWR